MINLQELQDEECGIAEEPSADEIQTFLDIFHKLDAFEANQRVVRGYGAFNEKEVETFPLPGVVKVRWWLQYIMEKKINERTNPIEANT